VKHVFPIRSAADLPEAIRAARFAMVQAGFRINDKSDLSFVAEKGSAVSTIVFGWRAGRNLWAVQYVDARVMEDGSSQVELSRNLFDDLLNEGSIVQFGSRRAFANSKSMVGTALQSAGLLAPVAPGRRGRPSKS
jgi:hypothetical protein